MCIICYVIHIICSFYIKTKISAFFKTKKCKSIQLYLTSFYFFLWYKSDSIETIFRKNIQIHIKNILYVRKEYPFSLWKMFLRKFKQVYQHFKGTAFLTFARKRIIKIFQSYFLLCS